MKWTIPVFVAALGISTVLYTVCIDSEIVGWFGSSVQLGSLILAAINLNMARTLYKPGDQPREAWSCLVLGTISWTIAQIIDIYLEFVLHQFPTQTVSDVFWIGGYILMFFGMIILIRNFLTTGLPAGSKFSYASIALFFFAIFVLIFSTVLLPDLRDPQKSVAYKFLLIVYPALDLLLIGAAAVLVRISWALRGGSLSNVWLFLCAGFAIGAGADLIYARLTDIESISYRYLDIPYFASYFCIAIAGRIQIKILQSLPKVATQ